MRQIVTAITASALALGLMFQAAPANAAVAGYDSSYAGESAFLNLDQGDTGSFTVFFANTGTTTWTRGSATQVDLAACLEDKVTCNAQDSDEATFNPGTWLSATRYTTHTQTSVAPGSIGTFTYDVEVPADAAADTYRFNGALVLASTGADIHNEGYFQDVTVAEGADGDAATLEELDPESGTTAGGTDVTITGEGFDCTPSFPTVMFGDNEADVISCGATQLVVDSPAGDEGEVDVTVTNAGAAASNALTFEYVDTTDPTFDSIDVLGQVVTLNFSEPVCTDTGTLVENTDLAVTVNGTAVDETSIEFADCQDDDPETTATVTVAAADEIVAGDEVRVTITGTGADKVEDASGNTMDVARSRSATAEADTTEPDIASAEVVSANTIRLTFTEPVWCTGTPADDFEYTDEDDDTTEATGITGCAATADTADTSFDVTFPSGTVGQGDTGELTYDEDTAEPISDISGNDLGDQTIDVTALEAEPPLIDDAQLTASAGLSGSVDSGDEWTLTFSEDMAAISVGDRIRVTDSDGTVADITCESTTLTATVTAVDDTDIEAACELTDDNELTVQIREDGSTGAEVLTAGDVAGVQYPATIIDTAGITDEEGNDPDLDDSADVVIEDE